MEQHSALCEECSKIPFQPGLQNLPEDFRASRSDGVLKEWKLGSRARIIASSCPFCKLVRSVWDDKEDLCNLPIEVHWTRSCFWVKPAKPGLMISMVKDHGLGNNVVCARKQLSSYIEFKEVRRWLSRCVTEHEGCRRPGRSSLTFARHRFRLIDVELNCVVEATKCERYVALSYVWGDSADGRLLLNQNTVGFLLRHKSLETLRSVVPSTIRDAISATKGLGERYLWVDSL